MVLGRADVLRSHACRMRHLVSAFGATLLLSSADASAQSSACTLQPTGVPSRQVIRCRDGLTIEAAAGADYTLVDRGRDGVPDSVNLRSGAVLVDAPAQPGRGGLQITTPQAIAAVRGTEWAADVAGGQTAIFVLAGRIFVRGRNTRNGVTLGPGQGVDVGPGAAVLEVRRWPPQRVTALLARFGR